MKTSASINLSCIIDDDDIYVKLLKKVIDIKNLYKKLIVFKNGKTALDYFKKITEAMEPQLFPEIIFLDLNMPVMDGWRFLSEFTKIKSPLKSKTTLYIVSSSINPEDIEKSKKISEVKDYLVKPIQMDHFESLFKPQQDAP